MCSVVSSVSRLAHRHSFNMNYPQSPPKAYVIDTALYGPVNCRTPKDKGLKVKCPPPLKKKTVRPPFQEPNSQPSAARQLFGVPPE